MSVDATLEALEAVKQGLLAGTVAQYPDAMAYVAIETMVKKLNGETAPEKVNSPVKLLENEHETRTRKIPKT